MKPKPSDQSWDDVVAGFVAMGRNLVEAEAELSAAEFAYMMTRIPCARWAPQMMAIGRAPNPLIAAGLVFKLLADPRFQSEFLASR